MTDTPLPEPLAAYAGRLLDGTGLTANDALTLARDPDRAGDPAGDPDSIPAALAAGWTAADRRPAQPAQPTLTKTGDEDR